MVDKVEMCLIGIPEGKREVGEGMLVICENGWEFSRTDEKYFPSDMRAKWKSDRIYTKQNKNPQLDKSVKLSSSKDKETFKGHILPFKSNKLAAAFLMAAKGVSQETVEWYIQCAKEKLFST